LAGRELVQSREAAFQTLLWLTERADGELERFETGCQALDDVDDAAALAALRAELAAVFARDHVARYAVSYVGRVIQTACVLLREPALLSRRLTVVIEAHDDAGTHLRAVRDVDWRERRPYLAALEGMADGGRFGSLLATRAERHARSRGRQPGVLLR
jgi:hypothetical protein